MLSRENAENEVIRHFEKTEETRKIITNLAKRSNSDIERWIQNCVKLSGLDDEQKETEANEIRRAVEASSNGTRREPTAAQEQGKTMCFTTQEVQEAREWQEKILRTREARGEELREQDKKGGEDEDDEWAPVVPNMEAGGSYLQTTDPRDVVEKVVMDDHEARTTGRGNNGLVLGREYRCETSGKGKGKGERGKGEHEGKGRSGGNGQQGSKGTSQSTRKVQDEEEEVREGGENERREAKILRDLQQLEEKRRAQEAAAEKLWHESREDQRIVKWYDCSDDEQERQEEKAGERGETCKVREWSEESEERRERGERESREEVREEQRPRKESEVKRRREEKSLGQKVREGFESAGGRMRKRRERSRRESRG